MSDPSGEMPQVLDLALRLAHAAGTLQRSRYETVLAIGTKSAPVDLVTEVDRDCERLIVAELAVARPEDAVVAEEGSGTDRRDADWRWIVDPLDGTVNYAHGYPRFCVSIGVERHGIRSVGVVHDPLLHETFHAMRGGGAFLNGRPIRVSEEDALGRGLFATGFAYDVHRSQDDNLARWAAFVKSARAVRRDGSAALDLCYVACGRLEGYWEQKLHAWDVAAGQLLVEEAGGRCSDFSGGPVSADGDPIVASNGRVHEQMLALLRSARR
ncbi:MAG TPA: inositol monophosphatase family protein [Myxococcota bacterium]|nr:inositol monophosphatase family protein [Myxococcota bacterium]